MTGDSPDVIPIVSRSSTLRVNPLRCTEQELISRLRKKGVVLQAVPNVPLAYTYSSSFSLGATEEYLLGYYYLQELASMFPILALSQVIPLSDLRILDMCAAPGSKTTQLASLMNNTGCIVALEENMYRCNSLINNLERCGVSNTAVFHKDAQYVSDLRLTFDAVLLDAPCSGNFCSEKNWLFRRTPTDVRTHTTIQKKLLSTALRVLRPGGLLVYSTCSLEVEENEYILDTLPDRCSLLPVSLPLGSPGLSSWQNKVFRNDMHNAVRLWPHRDGTQGFFLAVIRKESDAQEK